MSLVDRIKLRNNVVTGSGAASLINPPAWLYNFLMGGIAPSASGIAVSEATAMNASAVYSCVKLISDAIATLPLNVYQVSGGGVKAEARGHPLFDLLRYAPNDENDAHQFKQLMMVNALLYPEAYAEIERNGKGIPLALWPIPSARVSIHRDDPKLPPSYKVNHADGSQTTIDSYNMFVLHGMAWDQDNPLSPCRAAREAIGLELGAEKFGAAFFGSGANAGGIVTYPAGFGEEELENFQRAFRRDNQGINKAGGTMFIQDGIKYDKTTVDPEQAQFLQTREFQVEEIARFYRVPTHMIYAKSNATYSNTEQENLEFIEHTLLPWADKWELGIRNQLFQKADYGIYEAEFNFNQLLRADFKTRFDVYHNMLQDGVYNADEVRGKEGDAPQPNDLGQGYYINNAMAIKGSPRNSPQPTTREGGTN